MSYIWPSSSSPPKCGYICAFINCPCMSTNFHITGFLLPLLSSLEKLATVSVPYCVVLVPTPDLAHQVGIKPAYMYKMSLLTYVHVCVCVCVCVCAFFIHVQDVTSYICVCVCVCVCVYVMNCIHEYTHAIYHTTEYMYV